MNQSQRLQNCTLSLILIATIAALTFTVSESATQAEDSALVSRYHLKGRSSRFYRRSRRNTSSSVHHRTVSRPLQASGNHLTIQHVGEALAPLSADSVEHVSAAQENQLASRYYLRKRSGRFFSRGRSRRS